MEVVVVDFNIGNRSSATATATLHILSRLLSRSLSLQLAIQELLRANEYAAPKDKLVCLVR